MRTNTTVSTILALSLLVTLGFNCSPTEAQIFDQLMNSNNRYSNGEDQQNNFASRLRNMMSVNVPLFYDMVKNGSSMGINVLSGLVKVERGQEAEKSGLTGSRPLSVRVFGVPVYERGLRVKNPSTVESEANEPKIDSNGDDELPIYT